MTNTSSSRRMHGIKALVFATLTVTATTQSPQPNIVFILADDMGWTDVSGGQTNLGNASDYYRTPNIDALAAAGMSFDHAYSCGPNCAPTRAALMSGQYPPRTGVYTVNTGNRGQSQYRKLDAAPNQTKVAPSIITLAETLKKAGYTTGHFGKWHLGDDPQGHGPNGQGFDLNIGGTNRGSVSGGSKGHFARGDGSFNLPNMPANNKPNQFMADRLTEEALAFMKSKQPFFVYLSHFSVHTPIQAPTGDIAAFNSVPKGVRHKNQTYAGMLKNLDDGLGRVMNFLETTADPRRPGNKLIGNTLVIFTSDNGGLGGYASAGAPGGKEVTHQHPLKSGKGALYEGGTRVPLIVRWDGKVTAKTTSSAPVASIDFYPTLTTIAGAQLPTKQPLDGEDILPLLNGKNSKTKRSSLFWHFPGYLQSHSSGSTWRTTPGSVIRKGKWKLHFYYETRTFELYDLVTDIGEKTNLATANPSIVQSLTKELRAWLVETKAALPFHKGTTKQVGLPGDPGPGSNPVQWKDRKAAASPPGATGHVMVSTNGSLLAFAGNSNQGVTNELWRYDGQNWTLLAPARKPTPRLRHAGVFDEGRKRLVVFGGIDGNAGLLADTWEFDGTNWSQPPPGPAPSPRRDHAMAHDSMTGKTLLFGGRNGSGPLADTWEFDGRSWRQLNPAISPPARFDHGMVTDSDRGACVLFGGKGSGTTELADTWLWNGQIWRRALTARSPPARLTFGMAYDKLRNRTIIFGGQGGQTWFTDTWEFDGKDWLVRRPGQTPPSRGGAQLAYDSTWRRVILFGGWKSSTFFNDTWGYQTRFPASSSSFGKGCGGRSGIPRLTLLGQPWLSANVILRATSLPTAVSMTGILFGGSNKSWAGGTLPYSLSVLGMPGCDLLVDPLISLGATAANGKASLPLAIPNNQWLVKGSFHAQASVLDPGANRAGIIVSNGITGTIGER
ncbi:MAG: sulfatase-like hydrolase/transferase [Planctomycetota bacterium]|nr:sulfatase-like hydrolase/transferase [Planctomycetota bacterium]